MNKALIFLTALLIPACTDFYRSMNNVSTSFMDDKEFAQKYKEYFLKEIYCFGQCILHNPFYFSQSDNEYNSYTIDKVNEQIYRYNSPLSDHYIYEEDLYGKKQLGGIVATLIPFIVEDYTTMNGKTWVAIRDENKVPYAHYYISADNLGTGGFGSWGYREDAEKFINRVRSRYDKQLNENEKRLENDRKEREKLRQKKKQELQKLSEKYGYSLCSNNLFFTQDKCIAEVDGIFFKVLQQTPDGTLVSFIKSPDYTFFITKNSIDSSLADGYQIYDGIFAVDGTYQYISVLGSTRTVKKLKRLK